MKRAILVKQIFARALEYSAFFNKGQECYPFAHGYLENYFCSCSGTLKELERELANLERTIAAYNISAARQLHQPSMISRG